MRSEKSLNITTIKNAKINYRELRLTQTIRAVDNEVENRTRELTIQLDAYEKINRDVKILTLF